jgi:CheY-like chemotaxis protein
MGPNILIASSDLDIYELVVDILEITFKGAKLDRARDYGRASELLGNGEKQYHLVLLDYGLDTTDDRDALDALKADFPAIADRIVLLTDSALPQPDQASLNGTALIRKPFSLDDFGAVVKKVCAG